MSARLSSKPTLESSGGQHLLCERWRPGLYSQGDTGGGCGSVPVGMEVYPIHPFITYVLYDRKSLFGPR